MIGSSWSSYVKIYRNKDTLIVEQESWCESEDKPDYTASGTIPGTKPFWRSVGTYLANQDEMWALPIESIPDISISGADGWQANVLTMCWVRVGSHKRISLGQFLLLLPDRILKTGMLPENGGEAALWHARGEAAKFVERLERIYHLLFPRSTVNNTNPMTLELPESIFANVRSLPAFFDLIEKRTEHFEEYIDDAEQYAESKLKLPKATGFVMGMCRSHQIDDEVELCRRQYLLDETLPPGFPNQSHQ